MRYKLITILFLTILGVFAFSSNALAVITSGSFTLKTSGGDYSTWAAFWDDLGNLTGDITLTVDASAFSESTAPATLTESLGGYTLTVTAATFPTTTDATTGPRFTTSYDDEFLQNGLEGAGTVIIEGIVAIFGGTTTDAAFEPIAVGTGHTFIIRRSIMKDWRFGIRYADSDVTLNAYNNIAFGGKYGFFIFVALTGYMSNNTIGDVTAAGASPIDVGSVAGTLENNLTYDSDSTNWANIGSATGNNNSCYDASCANASWSSGSNNRDSKTADPFTNSASNDYTLTVGSDPVGNGKDLSGSFSDDFFGTTRSTWDIGAVALVNSAPTITSVEDYPDPEEISNTVTFSVDWNDADTEGIKMLICKTDAITAATPVCDGGEWCSNKDDYDLTDPITCAYTLTASEVSSNDYYAFVCDNEPACSSSTSGTFTGEAASSPSIKFPGGTNFKGGTIIK